MFFTRFIVQVHKKLRNLIIHMSDDILSFPNIEYFCIHFGVFVRKKLKNNQNPRFGNILFVCKGSFVCVSSFLYGRGLKALKINFSFFLCCFVFPHRVLPILFFYILIPNTLKNTQKTLFWWRHFLFYQCKLLCIH